MTAAWILVLLLVAFVSARLFRSTNMWWTLFTAIVAGLLVGMLSKEVAARSEKNKQTTSITQLVDTNDNQNLICMQSLVETVTEGSTVCQTGVASNEEDSKVLSGVFTSNTMINGRDSPEIEDDS